MSLRPFDAPIANSGFNGERYQDTRMDIAFEGGKLLGDALMQVGRAFATCGFGLAAVRSGITALGRDVVRAQILTQGVTQTMKYAVGRTRPDGSSNTSFPSAHSSGTFASATVLHRHYGWKAGLPAYGVASWVAASRLNENRHFLSDVAFGATVGVLGARTVMFDCGSTRFEVAPLAVRAGASVQLKVIGR